MLILLQKIKEIISVKKQILILLFLLLAFLLFVLSISLPPKNFQPGLIVEIEEGQTIKHVAENLKNNNLIKSDTLFTLLVQLNRSHVVVGTYIFKHPESIFTVVRRIAKGNYGSNMIQITFFEGMTNREIAKTLSYYFPNFNEQEFLQLTNEKEGYLFPDTYMISDLLTTRQIVKIFEDNFQAKIASIADMIKESKYSLKDIIIMASIVEKEATADSRQEVANILWKRYEEDFPLQVDAPFVYSIGKGTFDLTKEDLSSKDPFNTYVYTGLIPSPISNPGLDSIKAAASPKETDNFYFLTGQDGKMYYAKNFEQHKKNRLLYLD